MRVLNYSAGPSELPISVLKQAQEELLSFQNNGFSIMEISHRSSFYENMQNEAIANVKKLYEIGDEFEVLFVQGGASMQFNLIASNFSLDQLACNYIDTDVWTKKAMSEAAFCQNALIKCVASSENDKYSFIPKIGDLLANEDASYTYICHNNTIRGTQYKTLPKSKAPLIIDASSDFFSKKMDFSNIGMLFGGLQKNAGISGVALCIIRKDLLKRCEAKNIANMQKYSVYAKNNSLFNTPPSFAIYMFSLVMKWLVQKGGLDAMNKENEQKAAMLYEFIDGSDFYRGFAAPEDRSLMNVSFFTPNAELDTKFWQSAAEKGLLGLKGHKALGGLRASIYNSCTVEKVAKLLEFMNEFKRQNS